MILMQVKLNQLCILHGWFPIVFYATFVSNDVCQTNRLPILDPIVCYIKAFAKPKNRKFVCICYSSHLG